MRLRVIGPYGGEAPGAYMNCFLLDGTVLLDAGSVCQVLAREEQARIRHVLLSHGHLDHVGGLPHMAVGVWGLDTDPVVVHALDPCLATLKGHLFNGELWPDFTAIKRPNGKAVFETRPLEEGRDHPVGDFVVKAVRVEHPVPTAGFIVSRGGRSIAYSSDTGRTAEFWEAVSLAPDLRALIVGVAFPNSMRTMAEATGHLAVGDLPGELAKIRRPLDFPVLVFGMKPEYEREMAKELGELRIARLESPKTNEIYEF